MDRKQGVYICSGCGIGESVDCEKLVGLGAEEFKTGVNRSHPFLCGDEGISMIKKDIETENVNVITIAACSPRVYADVFNFGSSVILERANLREHVAWSQPPKEENTQMLAEDYLRMGIIRADKSEYPEPETSTDVKSIMVIGGGITGLSSAIESAEAGYEVTLLEKSDRLGGFAAKLYKQLPTAYPYRDLEEPSIGEKIKLAEDHSGIKIVLNSEVESVSGMPGEFDVKYKVNGSSESVRVGSFVVATGWKPYDAGKLDQLGYGKFKNVITSVQLEEMASSNGGKVVRPGDGGEVKSALFVQCAGSRDEKHLAYCSTVCCMTSLKQASYLRTQDAESKVYVIYKDMITPAQQENLYKEIQTDEGIFLTKGEVAEIEEDSSGDIVVSVKDSLLGGDIKIRVNLLVLATGMEPNAPDALQLNYRQGLELPTLNWGFTDSHYICFPYETQRTGIYTAGVTRSPMTMSQCVQDATGAALKAIQSVEMKGRGETVHPRAGDSSLPIFNFNICTSCKRCTEECPFSALEEDEKGTPKPNPNRCRACGICFGACPVRAINFKNYSMDMIGSMIKGMEIPDEDEDKPRILALFCENDAYPALDIAGINRMQINPYVRVIPVRCLGSVNTIWINDALNSGIDGILLGGCRYGENYQCHYIKGSELANRRMENVQETLKTLMLEEERVQQVEITLNDYDRLPQILNDFVEEIEAVGPNPFKGF
ncbi:MAG: FAD-dependent oxidoreductase [Spirochaetota bacterium]|nr:FAD-dependent oxidoreductase [Spirochaetota bacterium]